MFLTDVSVAVNQPSQSVLGMDRIEPGDRANSVIWHKINGTQDAGARMPRNRPPLSAEQIELIGAWIDSLE